MIEELEKLDPYPIEGTAAYYRMGYSYDSDEEYDPLKEFQDALNGNTNDSTYRGYGGNDGKKK